MVHIVRIVCVIIGYGYVIHRVRTSARGRTMLRNALHTILHIPCAYGVIVATTNGITSFVMGDASPILRKGVF